MARLICRAISEVSNALKPAWNMFSVRSIGSALGSNALRTAKTDARGLWKVGSSTLLPARVSSFVPACGAHFKGDQELSQFLDEEIQMEKTGSKTQGQLPSIQGFTMERAEGPEVVFMKKFDNEIIKLRFNINNSIDEEMDANVGEASAEIVARPPFTVELDKGGNKVLMIHCAFPEAPMEGQAEGSFPDAIELTDLAIIDKGKDWSEKVYTVQGSILDGNLYDIMLNMMEDRGITADALVQLIQFSTEYEHQQYVKFLENLKSFVAK